MSDAPLTIRMHERDNVAIVANDGGLAAGTVLPAAWRCAIACRRPTRWRCVDIAAGEPVLRYGVAIGHAAQDIPRGQLGARGLLQMPTARGLDDLPIATATPEPLPPLEGYTFEGYRNADGSVGTRNILAITTTVQCVAGVVDHAVQRIKAELLPRFPNVDDVVALEHTYGCGVAIDAPGAAVPIRTLRNISLNPNFGGEAMVVSLGCEKLQPDRLLPPGSFAIARLRAATPSSTSSACRTTRTSASWRWSTPIMRQAGDAPRSAERAAPRDLPGLRPGRRPAVRRQRRLLRRHRQPGGRLLRRPAGARRRDRDVLGGHRGARRASHLLTARAATRKWPRD